LIASQIKPTVHDRTDFIATPATAYHNSGTLFLAKNPTFATFDCQIDFIIMQAEHSFGIGKFTHNHNVW
jgi:hypothetical protein